LIAAGSPAVLAALIAPINSATAAALFAFGSTTRSTPRADHGIEATQIAINTQPVRQLFFLIENLFIFSPPNYLAKPPLDVSRA
jgi:hypothetical protein